MSDVSSTTTPPPAATTPSTPLPLPNDQAARSPTGEILEPSQIAANAATKIDPPPAQTSTSTDPKAPTDGKDPKAAAGGAPETYTDFTAPDGYTLDKAAIDAATPIFKELGLSQDQAQRLVEFHSKQMIEASKAPAASYEATRAGWRAEVDADADIRAAVAGGKTGVEAVKIGISKTLAALGDPKLTADFKAAMDLTGAGDNPAFIKAMWKLSSFITEGTPVQGQNPSLHGQRSPGAAEKPSVAQALYPNLS